MKFRVLATTSALVLLASAPALAQTPPPASAFGRLPALQDVQISPNGQTIAILGGKPDQRTLSMAGVDSGSIIDLNLADTRTYGVQWVDDQYALLNVVVWDTVTKGSSYNFARNILVDRNAKAGAALLSNGDVANYALSQPLLAVTAGDKAKAYVQGIDWSTGALSTRDSRIASGGETPVQTVVWKVDVPSGKGSVSERGTIETDYFELDLTGEARVRRDSTRAGSWTLKARAKGQSAWKVIYSSDDYEDFNGYLGYGDAQDSVYLAVAANGGIDLTRVGLADGSRTVIGHTPNDRDVRLVWDNLRDLPVGIVSERDRPEYVWLDPEIGAAHTVFAKAFKNRRVTLVNWSRDRSRFVARVEAPDAPPAWYLFDKVRKELSPLGDAYPELAGAALGKTRFYTYKARDGLEIPAYLTLPPGATETAKLPVIVMPHGGPASRDAFGFDFIVQYLATRGYAVLQPQFRGSGGFGDDFERAGRREWGGKVQTDLLDGLADLAGRSVVDADRACIVGASFGGYAALAGASLHPEAYRCAVAIADVSDLGLMLGETRGSYGKDSDALRQWTSMIGRVSADAALINAWSPVKQVARIEDPVLLIHGEYDTTVPIIQSQVMQRAMATARKPVEFVTLKGDDHYLSQSRTRTQTLEALGAFLEKHLPVK